MRIILIKAKGLNALNWEFSEAECFRRALGRLNVDALVWGPGYPEFNAPLETLIKKGDVLFLLENYEEKGWIPDLSGRKELKLFWSIDSHCALEKHRALCKRLKINIVLNSTHRYVSKFRSLWRKCHWFPNACPTDLVRPLGLERTVDVGFCGNMLNRQEAIDYLSRRHAFRKDIFVIGHDMVRAVNGYKIHWNRNIADDINFRTFETLGCGTFLLTNETDRLRDLFDIGRHLVVYDGLEDCSEKIALFLRHEPERLAIAAAGHAHLLAHHTFDVRAAQLLEIIGKA